MPEYTDAFVTVHGCRLHYQDWGNADAPPLLFVHGLTQQSHVFDGPAGRLRDRYHCIAMDLRGRGESAWAPPETYSLPHYAADALGLLDTLKIEATDYVGTSLGGLTAMAIAHAAPHRLHRVVLNDIGPELAAEGIRRIAENVAARSTDSFESVEDFVERGLLAYFTFLRNRPRAGVVAAAQWAVRQGKDGRWRVKHDPAVQHTVANDPETRRKRELFLWEGFRKLVGSVLLVRGAESDLLSPEGVARMREAQPGMEFVEVAGASHAPTLDEPEAVAALEAFFA